MFIIALPLNNVLSQINPVLTVTPYSLKVLFDVSIPYVTGFPLRFSDHYFLWIFHLPHVNYMSCPYPQFDVPNIR
jgi:hypothetical protein